MGHGAFRAGYSSAGVKLKYGRASANAYAEYLRCTPDEVLAYAEYLRSTPSELRVYTEHMLDRVTYN